MQFYPGDPDHQPIRYVGRVPVFAATIIAVLYVVGMLVTTMIATADGPIENLAFSTEKFFLHGWIWQLVTCTFVNSANFFFLFGVFFFYQFGVEVERYLGRRLFLGLYFTLLVTIAAILGLWRLIGIPGGFAGMYEISVGLLIAYATLYPGLEYWGWVSLKYVAFACLAIAALGYFPAHDWPGLTVLLAISGASFCFVRHFKLGGSFGFGEIFPKLNPFRQRGKFRVLPSAGPGPKRASGFGSVESVDPILDKIAQKGFASLTQAERDQLEKAREILNKKRP